MKQTNKKTANQKDLRLQFISQKSSLYQTLLSAPGIPPDSTAKCRSRAITAGRELHPALKTNLFIFLLAQSKYITELSCVKDLFFNPLIV
jgi:hypothetical protein